MSEGGSKREEEREEEGERKEENQGERTSRRRREDDERAEEGGGSNGNESGTLVSGDRTGSSRAERARPRGRYGAAWEMTAMLVRSTRDVMRCSTPPAHGCCLWR